MDLIEKTRQCVECLDRLGEPSSVNHLARLRCLVVQPHWRDYNNFLVKKYYETNKHKVNGDSPQGIKIHTLNISEDYRNKYVDNIKI